MQAAYLFTDVDTLCRLTFDPLLSLHVEVVHIEDVQQKFNFLPCWCWRD